MDNLEKKTETKTGKPGEIWFGILNIRSLYKSGALNTRMHV